MLTIYGAPEGVDAALLRARRAESAGPIVHVARDDSRMARLEEGLAFFMPEAEVLRFPAWDCLPYDRVSPNPEIVAERVATLAQLAVAPTRPRILLTTVNALVQKVPPRAVFSGSTLALKRGGRVDPAAIIGFLEANGYNRSGTVMEYGEYAVRGGIIDLFPAGEGEPIRIDMFGDEIDAMRAFDPATQRSGANVHALTLRPVGEVFLDRDGIARFREGYRELFGAAAADDPLYVSISAGRRHPGMEHWAGLFHEHMETLLDHLGEGAIVSLDHQAGDVLTARLEMIADHYEARRLPARIADGETPIAPRRRGGFISTVRVGMRCWRRASLPFSAPSISPRGRVGWMRAAARAGFSWMCARRARMCFAPMPPMRRPRSRAAERTWWRRGRAARPSGCAIC